MALQVKAQVIGIETVLDNILKEGKRWQRAVASAVYSEGNAIMRQSKQIVPLDLGPLRASGYVTMPEITADNISVELGYGGEISRDYAVVQHENMTFKHAPGRQAKYLEEPYMARMNQIEANIAKLAQAAFDGNHSPRRTMMPISPSEGEHMYAAQIIGKLLQSAGRDLAKQAKGVNQP